MTRKKKKQTYTPCFIFTPEMILVTQEALKAFEQPLGRADHQRPKVQFAEETVRRIKGKLDALSTPAGQMRLTAFDYNERVVITTAIQLYMLELMAVSVSPQREKELQRCQQLMRFALDSEREPER